MQQQSGEVARVVSVVASVFIALACGTNYAYSTWAPQFAYRLELSSTESNAIGSSANLGMYIPAVAVGIVIDSRGPKLGVASGAVFLGLGYIGIYVSSINKPGVFGVATLCFFAFLTGFGSCAAFLAALKTAAVNYPDNRGTATGLALAGFGLSAFIISSISALAFQDDISKCLMMLAILTFSLNMTSFFFVKLLPPLGPGSRKHRTGSNRSSQSLSRTRVHSGTEDPKKPASPDHVPESFEESSTAAGDIQDTASLLPGEADFDPDAYAIEPETGISGVELLKLPQFWYLFFMFGLLTGIGLMNINNIGNDTQALWHHYDDSASPTFIAKQQSMHVSILSLASCAGRLLSGAGSDLLVKKLGLNRMWCLTASAIMFSAAELSALYIENPHQLAFLSVLTGLGYGILYGFFPGLLAQEFGVQGLSQNWGATILAPVISGNVFNLLYGKVYDKRSVVLPGGERECLDGRSCYRTASFVALCASCLAVAMSVVQIWRESRHSKQYSRYQKKRNRDRNQNP